LYGSITTTNIAAEVNKILGLENGAKGAISRIDIILKKPIKDIGVHSVKVDLYSGIFANVKVVVARSESEAELLLAKGSEDVAKQDVVEKSKSKKSTKVAEAEQADVVQEEVQ
jgi:large subunit ribosomal protein L9